MWARIKAFYEGNKDRLYLMLIIVLVAVLAFGLGRLSVYYGEKGELKVEYPTDSAGQSVK